MKRQLILDEIKKIELDLLIEFREICNKLGLRYYIFGGTLLGAIRHKGFIPWDDDIDVCMPRPDYNKLIEFIQTYKSETNKFIFFGRDIKITPILKFVNIKTSIDTKYVKDEMHKYIWIDIVPLDGLSNETDELKYIYKKAEQYRIILLLCGSKIGKGTNLFRTFAKILLKPFFLVYGKQRAIKNLHKLSTRYDYEKLEHVGAITWGIYGVKELMLKSDIGIGCEVEFENEKFNTFCCWDSYLKSLYGDYMQLPPVEKRKTHNMIAWIDEN